MALVCLRNLSALSRVFGPSEVQTLVIVYEVLQIISLCIVWYSVSAFGNVIVKALLNEFPFPLTVTLVQLLSVWLYSIPLLKLWHVPPPNYLYQNRIYYFKVIIPLSIGKFLAQFSSHVSIWKVPVSYAHTVKATMPFFTVVLSRIILREKQSLSIYMSLIPIIVGVIIATVTELSFNMVGLISALLSTFGFSLQNIYSKKSLKDISIHHLSLLAILAKISWCMFAPFWFFYDGIDIYQNVNYVTIKIIGYLFVDGILNFIHNVVAFTMISLVSPLSYSIANSSKRIVVIAASLFILQNPVTNSNLVGMAVALIGVFLYNKAKFDQRRAKHKEAILPFVKSEPNLTANSDSLQMDAIQQLYGRHVVLNPNADLTSRHHQLVSQPMLSTSSNANGFIPQYASQTFKDV
ncbi:unnamed protein product [Didymodactylos carnosus]|uniref:Sugar phosphate transporter domain-containing protein n=1 Tax=Didymodactylos carnosus TaxID=1234261 RepID=A0A813SXF5_9BILA|nr:unnamed protein product [Didymodactylos carnosus]CAF0801138.1 unnamed protein product [Didymodactylos carnosus]CAF3528232.1 unnamed protein product [Didymodactylos carnosus]CAF3586316.1 unnamed protein product [Didymodactylos carnosus]